jgi:hypothetical protein
MSAGGALLQRIGGLVQQWEQWGSRERPGCRERRIRWKS